MEISEEEAKLLVSVIDIAWKNGAVRDPLAAKALTDIGLKLSSFAEPIKIQRIPMGGNDGKTD